VQVKDELLCKTLSKSFVTDRYRIHAFSSRQLEAIKDQSKTVAERSLKKNLAIHRFTHSFSHLTMTNNSPEKFDISATLRKRLEEIKHQKAITQVSQLRRK
jgi:hypothetical protein